MKRWLLIGALCTVNAILVLSLFKGAGQRGTQTTAPSDSPDLSLPDSQPQAPNSVPLRPAASTPSTPFAKVYVNDPKRFAANLRAIGCPEQTIKDILEADIHQRFHEREEALRPKPADHVPFMWSAGTAERRLTERRQQAAALAREESVLLSDTLGREASVSMPQYAMRNSNEQFRNALETLPAEKQAIGRAADYDYWAGVEALQARTKGFWLPEDLAELNQLKAARQQALLQLVRAQ